MKLFGKLRVCISTILVISMAFSLFVINSFASAPTVLPVISRNVPAYASANVAKNANDNNYGTSWSGTLPGWLAYDLSGVPSSQRGRVVVVWYNSDTYDYDPSIKSQPSYGMPSFYTIEANAAAGGGSVPTSGWVNLVTVPGNIYHSRQHVVDLTGYNWIRMSISQVNSVSGNYASINLDVHDASQGVQDDWIFYGDSITAGGMALNGNGKGTFAQIVNASKPSYFPVAECGGVGSILSSHGAQNISKWLKNFPGKYVGIAYGTNDSWGNQTGAANFYKYMESIVKAVIAAEKVPVVAKIPWSRKTDISKNAPSYNEQIEALYKAYPQVLKGPDFWTFFQNNPTFISSDDVHPNTDGYNAMREQWAKAAIAAVYNDTPPATPTPLPTPTPAGNKISGYISPDFASASPSDLLAGFNVEINGTDFSATTDRKGYFELNNVPSKSSGYTLKISKNNYLQREVQIASVTGNVQLSSSASPVKIWAGDLKINGSQDNAINMTDIMQIASAFNSAAGSIRYIADYDVNMDNAINMTDIIIVANHFNAVTSSYPAL